MRALAGSTPNARCFLLFNFLLSLAAGIYNVIFNLYVLKLGYDEQFLGLIISVSTISTGLCAFPAARCCDRMGSKACLVISGLLTALSLYLLYTVTSKELLLALSIISGIFGAIPLVIAAPFLVENSSSEDRLHLFSLNYGLLVIATIAGTALGGGLPGLCPALLGVPEISVEAYRYTLMVSLALTAISVVPLVFIRDLRSACPARAGTKVLLGNLLVSKAVRRLAIISGLIGLGAGLIVPFFNVYFNKILQATPGDIGIIFSLAQASMIVAVVTVPYLARRFGKVKLVSLTYLISLPFLLLLLTARNLYVAGAAYVLRMVFMNMSHPVSNSFSMEIVPPEDRASVSSLTSTANCLTIAGSSLLAGVLMSAGDYRLPYLGACACYMLTAILYYRFFHRYEAKAAKADEIEIGIERTDQQQAEP